MDRRRLTRPLLLAAACLAVAAPGLAHAQEVGPGGTRDPLERLNRGFFHIHQFLDRVILRPAAMVYTHVLPSPIRRGLKNAVSNLGEPAVFVNDLLQVRPGQAGRTVARFAVNSTAGLAGLIDVAKSAGFPHKPNDFGITLARYGVKTGPYLFIPLAGPITVRDAIGEAVNLALDPVFYVRYRGDHAVAIGSLISSGLEERADVDQDLKALYATATDPYASMRSYYLQNRQSEVTGGKVDLQALPSFDDEPAAGAPPAAAPPPPAASSPVPALPDIPSEPAPAPAAPAQ